MVDRFSHFVQGEVVKDVVPVVIQDPQVVGLFEVPQDHVELLAVALLDVIFRYLLGDVLFDAFLL